MGTNLFITFNPDKQAEQSTALRMQTISSLYGLNLELPARQINGGRGISSETKERVRRANFVLAISLNEMSPTLQEELQFAIEQNKTIIVLYDKLVGKTIDFKEYKHIQEIHIDFNKTDETLHQIAQFLKNQTLSQQTNKSQISNDGLVLGLLGVGLGLLALWALSKDE